MSCSADRVPPGPTAPPSTTTPPHDTFTALQASRTLGGGVGGQGPQVGEQQPAHLLGPLGGAGVALVGGDDRAIHQDVPLPGQPVSYTHLRAHETDSYLVCR